MRSSESAGPKAPIRVLLAGALGVTSVVSFLAGTQFRPPQPVLPAVAQAPVPPPAAIAYDTTKGFPQPDAPRPVDPREAEAFAVNARAKAIRRDAQAIVTECRLAAGGDWDLWQRDTDRYRSYLRTKVSSLKTLDPALAELSLAKYAPLEGRDNFPLFEVAARTQLKHLYDPASLDQFRRQQPVVVAQRWLRERGIDLIFVALPKMTEVYIEHFFDRCPKDGIIAPHVRQALLELLDNDVEVVDGFRLFRPFRDTDAEYLYHTADTHWAPRAMRITARRLADRIERYRFGARARQALPAFKSALGPAKSSTFSTEFGKMLPPQDGWQALSPEQRERAAGAQTSTDLVTTTWDDRVLTGDPNSPVLVIGHSYVNYFTDHLARELNMQVRTISAANGTTEAFDDFLRDPETLARCRVVVWITTGYHMTRFHPLPPPIAADTFLPPLH
jgi:hypothetical protein